MSATIDGPKFIDLFAGCGGLSLGLEQAGFFPLFVNELNSDAMETYLRNRDAEFPHLRERFNANDIKSVVSDEGFFDRLFTDLSTQFGQPIRAGEVDLVTGGPPCQGFSGIGLRRSYSVDKKQLPSNHLFQDMAYFVHHVRPKVFLFENVEGLLRSRWTKDGAKGEAFTDVLNTFRSLEGYTVSHKLVHAKDYAVPQNRPRVLLVGVRDDLLKDGMKGEDAVSAGFLPAPIGMYPHLVDVLSDLVDPNFEYGGKTNTYINTAKSDWQKEIRTLPNGQTLRKGSTLTDQEYSKHSPTVQARFQAMIENGGAIPLEMRTKKFAQRLLPETWGNQGPTITACSLPDDFVHFSQPRTLTVREWARLQTFPDWYEFAGKRTTGGIRRAGNPRENIFDREVPKYTQIGNAVPPRLGQEVGKHILRILGQD
ncbi:DNA cytosine methyltransferase [Yoonia sp. R78084]|uniref:DNA cytosine methyltransferase n=1 Tax=Yoonia sp. R78084 TaxID=3093869 RepID=UPI0037DC86BA